MRNNTPRNDFCEDEIDAIRLMLYEKTKDLTASEITVYIKNQIAPTVEKFNLSIVPQVTPVASFSE